MIHFHKFNPYMRGGLQRERATSNSEKKFLGLKSRDVWSTLQWQSDTVRFEYGQMGLQFVFDFP